MSRERLAEIERLLQIAEEDLSALNARSDFLKEQIASLRRERELMRPSLIKETPAPYSSPAVSRQSSEDEKIRLFRSLFRGREDIYARRFESRKTGKSGYQPACKYEWAAGICKKPAVKCSQCNRRELIPISDSVIRNHLSGNDPGSSGKDFTIGIYPLLEDETCRFLAVDFDGTAWAEDAWAFIKSCRQHEVPAYLERSRSGNGGHVWIFFADEIPARLARSLGSLLLTETIEQRPEIGLRSYDRLFPNQDTMPQGGFGNLIALPLQRRPRQQGNSLFLDDNLMSFHDQWSYLASIRRLTRQEVESMVRDLSRSRQELGPRSSLSDVDEDEPWKRKRFADWKQAAICYPLPERLSVTMANQLYISKSGLTPSLRNRLIRLAAFPNPEFHRAQAMRLSTYGKPRIICCAEEFPEYVALPRGCLEELKELAESLNIALNIQDMRENGRPLQLQFHGELTASQAEAAQALLCHDTGVLAAPTAFGKTVVAAWLIAQRRVNTLVLVHTRQLLDQWKNRLESFLELEPGALGQIGAGKKAPTGWIDVAVMRRVKPGNWRQNPLGHLLIG
jgi:hypothetical protein